MSVLPVPHSAAIAAVRRSTQCLYTTKEPRAEFTRSGGFAVGRVTFAWADEDHLSESTAARRELLVWMWYPATPPKPETTAEYLPPAWRAALARYQGRFMNSFFKRDPVVRTHSFSNAPVSPDQPQIPGRAVACWRECFNYGLYDAGGRSG